MGLTRSFADRPGRSSPLHHPIFIPSRTVERSTRPSFAEALRTPMFSATIAYGNTTKVHSNAIAAFPIDAAPPALPPRNAKRPAALSDDRPSETDLSHNRKPQRNPDAPQQSSCRRKRGAALSRRVYSPSYMAFRRTR